jgi:hypothetical protein
MTARRPVSRARFINRTLSSISLGRQPLLAKATAAFGGAPTLVSVLHKLFSIFRALGIADGWRNGQRHI